MHELDAIELALSQKKLNHILFERFVTDVLIEVYPGLTPIAGGTDWGRDGDISDASGSPPVRLLVTTARTLDGVKKNMVGGLRSLNQHGLATPRIVLANPGSFNQISRQKIIQKAGELGVTVDQIYGREFFASKLRRDGQWRKELLGLSSEPISVSRMPVDMAESTNLDLRLIGREELVESLAAIVGDIVLYGRPGVGKTRIAYTLDDVLFIDTDADIGRLADDLKWLNPSRIVIDDAGRHARLLRQLARLRVHEPDLLRYQIIAICWPDEVQQLQDVLRDVCAVEIDLLERKYMDEILQAANIRIEIVRQQILDQAEGRPGWALAIADMLLKIQKWQVIADGKVLLGQVTSFLRRVQATPLAISVLSAVAALDGLLETEIQRAAEILRVSDIDLRGTLSTYAHAGLVDVINVYSSQHGRNVRRYDLRPPMLARALVAEHVFRAVVPVFDLKSIAISWPEKTRNLAVAAIFSTMLGASDARSVAQALFSKARLPADDDEFVKLYLQIDRRAGEEVLRQSRVEFENLDEAGKQFGTKTVASVAALVLRRYGVPAAATLLLDMAQVEDVIPGQKETPSVAAIGHVISEFHPELPIPKEVRYVIARQLDTWIDGRDSEQSAWRTYVQVLSHVFSLTLNGRSNNPADRRELRVISAILWADEVHRIRRDVWPSVASRLGGAPPVVLKQLIDIGSASLSAAAGYDYFNRELPADASDAARELGRDILLGLKSYVAGYPELTVFLRDVARQWHVEIDIEVEEIYEAFYSDADSRMDWLDPMSSAVQKITKIVDQWEGDTPDVIISRLVNIKSRLASLRSRWPSPIQVACEIMASWTVNPTEWVELALTYGLFPEASPFLVKHINLGKMVSVEQLQRLAEVAGARSIALHGVLTSKSTPVAVVDAAVGLLVATDEPILVNAVANDAVGEGVLYKLLADARSVVRGETALAMFEVGRRRQGWSPGDLESEWLAAVKQLVPHRVPGVYEDQICELYAYLDKNYHQHLVSYVEVLLDAVEQQSRHALYEFVAPGLRFFSAAEKNNFLAKYGDSDLRGFLVSVLPENDLKWLEQALDGSLIEPEEALECHMQMESPAEPSIVDLAKILIPRGVDPREIAFTAQIGGFTGENSERLDVLVTEFGAYAKSGDASVAALGRAGLEIYKPELKDSQKKDRIKGIRGDL